MSNMRMDKCLERGGRVADPADIRCHIKRRVEPCALLVGTQSSERARDQFRAQIVRMTAERGPTGPLTLEQRSQIGAEAIVTRNKLVKLTAARDVLILERLRLATLRRPAHRGHHFIVNRG